MIFPWKGQRSDSKIDQPHVFRPYVSPFFTDFIEIMKEFVSQWIIRNINIFIYPATLKNELFVTLFSG